MEGITANSRRQWWHWVGNKVQQEREYKAINLIHLFDEAFSKGIERWNTKRGRGATLLQTKFVVCRWEGYLL